MNFRLTFICILFVFSLIFNTTLQANTALIPDVMVLRMDEHMGVIYMHQLKKNQTIYGLSKFFNTDLDKISAANPSISLSDIKLDQEINIPINTDMISSERNLSPSKSYIPVFYTVKAKDNLFRISKVYFHQSIENVMKINKLYSMELSVGQKILVGWYEYDQTYKEKLAWTQKGIEVNTTTLKPNYKKETFVKNNISTNNSAPAQNKNQPISNPQISEKTKSTTVVTVPSEIKVEEKIAEDKNIEIPKDKPFDFSDLVLSSDPFQNRNGMYEGEYPGKPNIISTKLRAEWNTGSKDKVNLFALHSSAKVNSYIEIYNPMLNRKVLAKVVGNLPPKAHKKGVELIVSPKVAESLGAIDKRFLVQVRFID